MTQISSSMLRFQRFGQQIAPARSAKPTAPLAMTEATEIKPPSDLELMEILVNSLSENEKNAAWVEIRKRYHSDIKKIVVAKLGSPHHQDVDEVLSHVFHYQLFVHSEKQLEYLRAHPNEKNALRNWLGRIASNYCKDILGLARSNHHESIDSVTERIEVGVDKDGEVVSISPDFALLNTPPNPEEIALARQQLQRELAIVRAVISSSPQVPFECARRQILIDHLLDRPQEQTAKRLGIPVGTVKSGKKRACLQLRDRLAEANGEPVKRAKNANKINGKRPAKKGETLEART